MESDDDDSQKESIYFPVGRNTEKEDASGKPARDIVDGALQAGFHWFFG